MFKKQKLLQISKVAAFFSALLLCHLIFSTREFATMDLQVVGKDKILTNLSIQLRTIEFEAFGASCKRIGTRNDFGILVILECYLPRPDPMRQGLGSPTKIHLSCFGGDKTGTLSLKPVPNEHNYFTDLQVKVNCSSNELGDLTYTTHGSWEKVRNFFLRNFRF